MEDRAIIGLFFDRSEQAITELSNKYGRLCCKIAGNILHNSPDTEECVNDTDLCVEFGAASAAESPDDLCVQYHSQSGVEKVSCQHSSETQQLL